MNIDTQAPVFQTAQIRIAAAPEKVWAVLADLANWPRWNDRITRMRIDATPAPGVPFRWTVNGAAIRSVLHTVTPCRAIGWSGVTFGGSAIHNWQLEPQNGHTVVSVQESMQGWLIRLFKNKMNRDLARDMAQWLEKLRQQCEGQQG